MTDHAEIYLKKLAGAAEHAAKLRMARDKARHQRDKAKRALEIEQQINKKLYDEIETLRTAIIDIGKKFLKEDN